MQVISDTDARNSLKAMMDRVIDDQDVILIRRRDGGNAVLLSEASYSSMTETLYLLANPSNAEVLMQSVAEFKAGKAQQRDLLPA